MSIPFLSVILGASGFFISLSIFLSLKDHESIADFARSIFISLFLGLLTPLACYVLLMKVILPLIYSGGFQC